uniref:B-cell antigen receptor complex-associated protein alpha chain n=1 Tax=Lutjanus sanguineus TaxID=264213 RepID=A0A0B5KJU2_9TELE|nr:B-cell antigen receptor complex-associated protein alpha chain [Lutjanus sanguineus]
MGAVPYFLLCSFVVVLAEVEFEPDMPSLRVKVNDKADLSCCYRHKSQVVSLKPSWYKVSFVSNVTNSEMIMKDTDLITQEVEPEGGKICGTLKFKSVKMEDKGLYRCSLNISNINHLSHGTYLEVYKPLEKTINITENSKNKILTAEGILLFLCVILPAATLLCQSKKLNQLERKKMQREEENIYQGLNLDDCCTTYDQIERSQAHGPYQDVCNIKEEEEEIQLEKP